MAEKSNKHGMEMLRKGDKAHIKAMNEMQALMQSPEGMRQWMDDRRKEFEALPEDA